MSINNLEKKVTDLEKRVDMLEKMISKKEGLHTESKSDIKKKSEKYEGLSGGISFLIDQSFFKVLRSKQDVHVELKKEGYYNSPQAVDTALRRDFVTKKKILTRVKEDNVWKYVLRK